MVWTYAKLVKVNVAVFAGSALLLPLAWTAESKQVSFILGGLILFPIVWFSAFGLIVLGVAGLIRWMARPRTE